MDEMKITSGFMRGIASNIISKLIKNKTGFKVSIKLNDLHIKFVDGVAQVHIDANGQLSKEELVKVATMIGI